MPTEILPRFSEKWEYPNGNVKVKQESRWHEKYSLWFNEIGCSTFGGLHSMFESYFWRPLVELKQFTIAAYAKQKTSGIQVCVGTKKEFLKDSYDI